jgi:hypothetical protein
MDKKSPEYKKAIKKANETYGSKSSIYRSSYIVKTYKDLGGKIKGSPKSLRKSLRKSKRKSLSKSPTKGITRWFKEEWVQVVPYLERKNKKECGGEKVGKRVGKACRPLHRITKDTPITISELLKIHSKEDILRVAKQKEKYPDKRVVWKTLSIQ